MVMMAAQQAVPTASTWFQVARPVPDPCLRLFCFSYAGGNASTYREWHKYLPADIEVCSVQLPGRGSRFREKAYTDLDQLLNSLVPEIEPYTRVPYVFFGHSMGAQLAFELARRLRDKGIEQPKCLIVSGRRAPQIHKRGKPIYTLPEAEFREEIRRLNGTPEEALNNPELMDLVSPILRADFQLIETWTYQPSDPIDTPVLALGGVKDNQVTLDDLEEWRKVTRGPFCLELFSGDHFFINQVTDTLLTTVSQAIECVLGRAEGLLAQRKIS
ncbi:MAG: putative thioesterase [Pseudomonadales bacterium]|nr:putative thioesterase [Pseudomonadales bacterium]